MKADILLGLQWGDEGKGKIVDVLAPKYDIVARFQGGPNAGHTLEFDGHKHVLRSIPSGVFAGGSRVNVIGNGVVLDPVLFRAEAEQLEADGVDLHSILKISIGIPKESLGKIWERFYKTDISRGKDKKGTGLGLVIVKEIIQSHKENINVISTEGVGTEFIFSLPLHQPEDE